MKERMYVLRNIFYAILALVPFVLSEKTNYTTFFMKTKADNWG